MVQATAEQMRLAQVIFDKNDSDFEAKVKQLMEVTGKNQDECIVALHDCNGDVNKAINILLEGNSDTTSWETVGGRKRILQKKIQKTKKIERRKARKSQVVDVETTTGKEEVAIVAENLEVKKMELIAIKWTNLQIVASEPEVEDLDVAEERGRKVLNPRHGDI